MYSASEHVFNMNWVRYIIFMVYNNNNNNNNNNNIVLHCDIVAQPLNKCEYPQHMANCR